MTHVSSHAAGPLQDAAGGLPDVAGGLQPAGILRTFLMTAAIALLVASPAIAQGGGGGGGGGRGQQPPPVDVPWNDAIPPGTPAHVERALKESSRHGEYIDIPMADGTKLNAFITFPERKDRAGVVLVIHDIRGFSDWARALADQLSQDGFIAIVPDFLSGKGPDGGGTASLGNQVGQAIRTLTEDEVRARLDAAMAYGAKLPASNGRTGVIGFCWGGARSFGYAMHQPNLNAAVVYYGEAPGSSAESAPEDTLARIKAPVLGIYAGDDARINNTLPATEAAMKKLGKNYERHHFEGSGHGFLGGQAGRDGANLKAAQQAWPLTVGFFRKHLQ
jgi:carboxymethylenebutenolidase